MKNLLEKFCIKNKQKIARFLSNTIKIKSYSSNEENLVRYLNEFFSSQCNQKRCYIKKINNNLLIFLPMFKTTKVKILYDAHIDTVPAENNERWSYPPFSGKVVKNKIYGRGSCDDKGSVTALVFTILFLLETNYNKEPIVFSLSSNEEDSSGKGIEEVLKHLKPSYCIICEPSDLKIVYGHKGKWCIKITFFGKTAHSSTPQLGKNAIYSLYPVIKTIIEEKNKNFISSLLGEPTYTITYIESKTNSLNSIPYEASLYIDYRSVLGETEQSIKTFLLKNLKEKNYKFEPQHNFFPAWILDENHILLNSAKKTYETCFTRQANSILWQFCTNGSITMSYKIPTIGFGPGSPFLAHQDNEYIKLEDIMKSIKFYSLLAYNLK
jgi:putative selenium metabolism hydrolase